MLVALKNKEISERWDIFRELIRNAVKTDPAMVPDRLARALTLALTGHIQCWLLYEEGDSFYGALVTQIETDRISGLNSLLVYAMGLFGPASRETRHKDMESLLRIAKALKCSTISAYSNSMMIVNSVVKAAEGVAPTTIRHSVYVDTSSAEELKLGDAKVIGE